MVNVHAGWDHRDAGSGRPHDGSRQVKGWEGLTDTQRRVAMLVEEGLTNAEIGQRLITSRHTVDFHLRQIYNKLEVHSRAALARLVVERDFERE